MLVNELVTKLLKYPQDLKVMIGSVDNGFDDAIVIIGTKNNADEYCHEEAIDDIFTEENGLYIIGG
jgi:hypothetical protein